MISPRAVKKYWENLMDWEENLQKERRKEVSSFEVAINLKISDHLAERLLSLAVVFGYMERMGTSYRIREK